MYRSLLKVILVYAVFIIGLSLIAEFLIFGGAHPECAFNDSVGPCEFVPRVSQYAGYVAFLLLPLFVVYFGYSYMKIRNNKNNEAK